MVYRIPTRKESDMARVRKLPKQLSALVSEDHYSRVKAVEDANPISMGDVIREALEAGLPSVEAKYAALGEALGVVN